MPQILTQTLIRSLAKTAHAVRRRCELADARVRGLNVRLGPGADEWSWRVELRGKACRVPIGSLEDWTLEDAREVVGAATAYKRAKKALPPDDWWAAQRARLGKRVDGLEPAAPARRGQLDFDEAREHYLAEVERTRRADTHRDYFSKLHLPELAPLAGRLVSTVARRELGAIVAAVHARSERSAETLATALRRMWAFLETDAWIARSRVEPGAMAGLKAPERSLREEDEEAETKHLPPMAEIGRVLAIARSGACADETLATAIVLTVAAAQRRRPVASAKRSEFAAVRGHGGLWTMPPVQRKTARRRKDPTKHVVPIPEPFWGAVAAQLSRAEADGSDWLFPAARARRRGETPKHMAPDRLTHAFMFMPGVRATPHAVRTAFGTHGEALLGNSRQETKAILDHNEGVASHDVTLVYALHDGTHFKWGVMKRWAKAVETACRQAMKRDVDLRDPERLAETMRGAERAYREAMARRKASAAHDAGREARARRKSKDLIAERPGVVEAAVVR